MKARLFFVEISRFELQSDLYFRVITVQSQKAVTAYFLSKQLLPFDFARQSWCDTQQIHLYNICTTLAQRLRRWSNIVQMVYNCFVLTYSWRFL